METVNNTGVHIILSRNTNLDSVDYYDDSVDHLIFIYYSGDSVDHWHDSVDHHNDSVDHLGLWVYVILSRNINLDSVDHYYDSVDRLQSSGDSVDH